jgi:hypothetical protein
MEPTVTPNPQQKPSNDDQQAQNSPVQPVDDNLNQANSISTNGAELRPQDLSPGFEPEAPAGTVVPPTAESPAESYGGETLESGTEQNTSTPVSSDSDISTATSTSTDTSYGQQDLNTDSEQPTTGQAIPPQPNDAVDAAAASNVKNQSTIPETDQMSTVAVRSKSKTGEVVFLLVLLVLVAAVVAFIVIK